MISRSIEVCPCCGNNKFSQQKILWESLIDDWGLDNAERKYIDRQQGFSCDSCGSNLRSMSLAAAIMKTYEYNGTFESFVSKYRRKLKVLEVNEAGHLNRYLSVIANHTLVTYPEVKMEKLPLEDNSVDLLVHSDTLEHVKSPSKALSEAFRVLKPGGVTLFTIPIVVGRLSKLRGDKKSYHGSPGNDEYLVVTEYGADMWTQVLQAGFTECRLISFDYPASIVVGGFK